MNYGPTRDPLQALARKDRGTISAYAQNDDYHDVIKTKLKRLAGEIAAAHRCEVKVFVDTAPVMEKPIAENAGVGWQGKHTISSTAISAPGCSLPRSSRRSSSNPMRRKRIIAASAAAVSTFAPPTPSPRPINSTRGAASPISPSSIRATSPANFAKPSAIASMAAMTASPVCPWNKFASAAREAAFQPREELISPRLAELARLDDATFRALFRKSPVKRIGRDRFVRNVLIAVGNSGDASLMPEAQRLLDDSSPLVRAMAVWALARLGGDVTSAANDADPAVRAEAPA